MKLLAPLLIILVLVITSLAVYGYFKATPGVENKTQIRPQIVITPASFDFGEVEFGKVVEHTFTVKNTGNEPLEIKRVSTSCACTKAKVAEERLEPGEKTELLVTYDAGAMGKKVIGRRVERFVYIKSNDSVNPQVEVTIYARVK